MGRYFWCCRAGSNSSTGPGSAGIPGSFARRAGLSRGQAATVVLVVEFLADGRTGSVEVSRSSGNSARMQKPSCLCCCCGGPLARATDELRRRVSVFL
jgi:hypothetical protein